MIFFITASKDATIYSAFTSKNTGLDQVLEVSNNFDKNSIARTLIHFDITDVKSLISSSNINNYDVRLIMRETSFSNVPINFDLDINAISGSWEMGDGYMFELGGNGVTWKYRNNLLLSAWHYGNYSGSVTGSNTDGYGGTWWSNYKTTQTYQYKTEDININISPIFNKWIDNTINNDGLLLKISDKYEYSTTDIKLNFYSKETNTIYQPKLYFAYDDSSFSTGSLIPLTAPDFKIIVTNIKQFYNANGVYKFKVVGSERNVIKPFTTTLTTIPKYLPSSSYYQVRDLLSNDIIIPFSEYTKISCDSNGNFFKLNLSNFEQRKYKFEFKIINNDDIYYEYSIDNTFQVNI